MWRWRGSPNNFFRHRLSCFAHFAERKPVLTLPFLDSVLEFRTIYGGYEQSKNIVVVPSRRASLHRPPESIPWLLKGSRQPESRGFRIVPICPNLSRAVAIDVLFSINFAVVFDFMYFHFRPSKAKWIGDVLTNRQNAANHLQRFFFGL